MKALLKERLDTKTDTLTLQDARLPCNKCRAYAAVGGRIGAEPAIRFFGRKDSIQNRAPWLCRMPVCYAASTWHMLRSEGVWTLNLRLDSPGRKDSIQKRVPRLCKMPDCYAMSAWPMLRSEGVYTLNLRLGSSVGRISIQKRAHRLCRMPDCYAISA